MNNAPTISWTVDVVDVRVAVDVMADALYSPIYDIDREKEVNDKCVVEIY